MNKILMAQIMGIMLALFHISTHSWLFHKHEDKDTNVMIVSGMGIGLNIIFFILVVYQISKGLLKNFRKPKLGEAPTIA